MHTWIALDADDSWGARCDKHQRWDDFPQPVYVLAGPGLSETERFLLVSDAPWTPDAVRATLAELYGPAETWTDDPQVHQMYTAWLHTWLGLVLAPSF